MGLCITCCKERPSCNRSTCARCSETAVRRSQRRRLELRERAKSQQIIERIEQAGDAAAEHHLYKDAAQYYKNALNMPVLLDDNRARIAEKLTRTLFLDGNPDDATPWLELCLSYYSRDSQRANETAEMLLQKSRHMWYDCRTKETLPIIEQAIRIADVAKNQRVFKHANLQMAHHLQMLGRHSEAQRFLDAIGTVTSDDDPSVRLSYHCVRGSAAAMRAEESVVYENFADAFEATKDTDPRILASAWSNYGSAAIILGNLKLGKICYERGLLVARQNQIFLAIPHLCLAYAEVLVLMGEQRVAYPYLLDALSYEMSNPRLDDLLAIIGIPLTLYMNDSSVLAKCVRPSTISRAFQSCEPGHAAGIAAAFAQLYIRQGKQAKARALLHRALEVSRYADGSYELLMEIALHGEASDLQRARKLLEARLAIPCNGVARAALSLFDAFVARRHGNSHEVRKHAVNAIEQFEKTSWYAYAARARTLAGTAGEKGVDADRSILIDQELHRYSQPFADMHSLLTRREREVAELALHGHTNRVIAEKLSIKERTVESHMTSIMSHLGIRSRHQLASL